MKSIVKRFRIKVRLNAVVSNSERTATAKFLLRYAMDNQKRLLEMNEPAEPPPVYPDEVPPTPREKRKVVVWVDSGGRGRRERHEYDEDQVNH